MINHTVKKDTLWAFLSILLYKIVLDLSYYYYFIISQVPNWSYPKLELYFNGIKLVESYFLLLIIYILLPKSSNKLSNILIWLLILLSYIPMLTIFAFKDEARTFMYGVTAFWVAVFLLVHMPIVSLAPLKQSGGIRYFLYICLVVTIFLIIYKYFGLSFSLDLTKAYDIRSQYVGAGIPLAGYLFNWIAYIVNSVFFALFIIKRKWLPVTLIIFLQILLFSTTGNKTYLFALGFVLVLMWIITYRNTLAYMAIGVSGIILLGMLSYWLIDNVWILSLSTRRTLLVPAQLSFLYYDFFSKHDSVFLSHSVFRFFLDYPYHLDPSHLIGGVYFGSPQMNANTGIVGDAYMNFGFVGFALWSILLAIILRLVDTCSRRVDLRVGVAAIAMPAITLTNSGLLTNLLTHGVLLALLLLYLLPRQK